MIFDIDLSIHITALLPVGFFSQHYNIIIISLIACRPTCKNVHQMSAPTDIEHILVGLVEVSKHGILHCWHRQ